MTPSDPHRLPDDLQDVAELLRGNRPEATALELDGVKRQVRSRVSRAASGRAQKGSTMKSKFAMMAMLVVGLLMSGTGAGLAVSGLGATESASQAQYPCEDNPATPRNECVPPTPTPTPPPLNNSSVPCDLNGDGVADATEDLNGPAPGCADAGDVLPNDPVRGGNSCDENGDGIISPAEAIKNGCGGVQGETNESQPAGETPVRRRQSGAQPTRQLEVNGDDELPFTGFAAIPILVGGIALMGGGIALRRRTGGE